MGILVIFQDGKFLETSSTYLEIFLNFKKCGLICYYDIPCEFLEFGILEIPFFEFKFEESWIYISKWILNICTTHHMYWCYVYQMVIMMLVEMMWWYYIFIWFYTLVVHELWQVMWVR